MRLFAKIIFRRVFFGKSIFEFEVPENLKSKIAVGQIVATPFKNEVFRGLVCEISEISPDFECREILRILTPQLLQNWQIDFLRKIARENYAAAARVLPFFLPKKIFESDGLPPTDFFLEIADKKKMENLRGKKQKQICEFLQKNGATEKKVLREKMEFSPSVLQNLIEKKIVRPILKTKFLTGNSASKETMGLSPLFTANIRNSQKSAAKILNSEKKVLLFGKNQSGKTFLIARRIAQILNENSNAQILILCDKIGVAWKAKRFFEKFFNREILTFFGAHFSENLKYEIFFKVKSGAAKIVIATRGGIFLPFVNLKFVAIDDFEGRNFKNQSSPRFDGLNLAENLAENFGAQFILSSSTPTFEKFFAAKKEKLKLAKIENEKKENVIPEFFEKKYPESPNFEIQKAKTAKMKTAFAKVAFEKNSANSNFKFQNEKLPRPACRQAGIPDRVRNDKIRIRNFKSVNFKNGNSKNEVSSRKFEKEVLSKKIEIINLKNEVEQKHFVPLSRKLICEIRELCEQKSNAKIVLFLNRRGFSTTVFCRECGESLKCKFCATSLTHHRQKNRDFLLCHLCSRVFEIFGKCENCGSRRIDFLGVGCEKVAEFCRREFPSAKIFRGDAEVLNSEKKIENIFGEFFNSENCSKILIGTEIVAKNFDEKIDLAAAILAENDLQIPQFRAAEKFFANLSRFAGRNCAKFLVQTFAPQNEILENALIDDFEKFFDDEIVARQKYFLPPFSRALKLIFKNAKKEIAFFAAQNLQKKIAKILQKNERAFFAPDFHPRQNGKYVFNVVVFCENPRKILQKVSLKNCVIDIDAYEI